MDMRPDGDAWRTRPDVARTDRHLHLHFETFRLLKRRVGRVTRPVSRLQEPDVSSRRANAFRLSTQTPRP